MEIQKKSVQLSTNPPTVLTFDGDVLECFFEDGSTRLHIVHIKGIELADSNGKYLLTIHLRRKDLFIWADKKDMAPVSELVNQVKQTMALPHS
jgi:hypothetical protein